MSMAAGALGHMARMSLSRRGSVAPTEERKKCGRTSSVPVNELMREINRRRTSKKMFIELIMFICFMISFGVAMVMQARLREGHILEESVRQQLVESTATHNGIEIPDFEHMATRDDFFLWLEYKLMPIIFEQTWYNGDDRSEDVLNTVAYESKVLGGVHLSQTRRALSHSRLCHPGWHYKLKEHCFAEDETFEDFAESAGRDDMTAALGATKAAFTARKDSKGAQSFFVELRGHDAIELAESIAIVEELRDFRWIDERTKHVEIDFTVFNINMGLFLAVGLEVEFDLAGTAKPHFLVQTLILDVYEWELYETEIRLFFEFVYLSIAVYMCVVQTKIQISHCKRSSRCGGFRVRHFFEWVSIFFTFSVVGMWVAWLVSPRRLEVLAKVADHSGGGEVFTEPLYLMDLYTQEKLRGTFNALNMMVQTFRSIRFFQITTGGKRLVGSIQKATGPVMGFLPIYLVIMIGFALTGHVLFGLKDENWSTIDSAIYNIFNMNFGLYNVYKGDNELETGSMIFMMVTTFTQSVLLLNVFLSIIMSTWEKVAIDQAEEMKLYSYIYPEMTFGSLGRVCCTRKKHLEKATKGARKMPALVSYADLKHQLQKEDLPPRVVETVLSWIWHTDTAMEETTKSQEALDNEMVKEAMQLNKSFAHSYHGSYHPAHASEQEDTSDSESGGEGNGLEAIMRKVQPGVPKKSSLKPAGSKKSSHGKRTTFKLEKGNKEPVRTRLKASSKADKYKQANENEADHYVLNVPTRKGNPNNAPLALVEATKPTPPERMRSKILFRKQGTGIGSKFLPPPPQEETELAVIAEPDAVSSSVVEKASPRARSLKVTEGKFEFRSAMEEGYRMSNTGGAKGKVANSKMLPGSPGVTKANGSISGGGIGL